MYSAVVQDHVYRPRNVGPLADATHQGTAGTPGNGPYVVLWLRIEGERIREAGWQSFGCPGAMSSASVTAELALGRTIAEALQLTEEDVIRALGGLPEGKEHCPGLAITALRTAIQGGKVS